jgi:hypothetical protein
MNDRSAWLPFNHKYLQLRTFFPNKQLIPLKVTAEWIHSRAGLAHF